MVLKLVSSSHPSPHTLKMHIMVRKLIPHSQTSPCTLKIFRKNFYELIQTFRISNQVLISLKINKKFMRQLSWIQYLMIYTYLIADFILEIKIILKLFINLENITKRIRI